VKGEGTSFAVRLPSRMPERAAEPAMPVEVQPSHSTAPRVLVIDDEESARDLLRRTLEREGYDVVCAASADDGLRCAREARPDLITLDILMPHVDGWSVLTRLKSNPDLEDIPVIVVTMTDDPGLCHALGAAEYMAKPVDRSRLCSMVSRLVGRRRDALVLIVEDDAVTRDLLERTVSRAGFRCASAENGRIALARLAEETPAVVLLDLVMPEMNGFELLARMREHAEWSAIPVVVVTAKELTPAEYEELCSSAEQVLKKGSYDRASLIAEVRRHLERADAREPGPSGTSAA